jgi:hypothetical protein
MTRWLGTLAALLVVLAPALAGAADAPHDQTFGDGKCENCHSLYTTSPGGKADYSQGCVTCHNALPSSTHGFPWVDGDQAVPGTVGNQHSWSGFASNPELGARPPSSYAIQKKLVDGKLQCAVCHDPHHAAPENAPDRLHSSLDVGVAYDEAGGPGTGTAKMTLVAPGTAAKAYRLKIQTVNAGGGTFVISHDFGLTTPSWFNWSGSAWVIGTAAGPGKPYANDAAVALDDAAVTVKWTAGAAAGDYWDFYVSYPFLRATNEEDAFCRSCHVERFMGTARVRGEDATYLPNGARLFSHPVNVGAGSITVLDANGVPQATGDGVASNDLHLDGGSTVRCTTCHAAHNADSNSLTDDAR